MTAATATPQDLPLLVRPAEQGDVAFVMATWLRACRPNLRADAAFTGLPWAEDIEPRAFFACHHVVIERLLARGAKLLVAAAPDSPDVIYGYLCHERLRPGTVIGGMPIPSDVVHFAFTKGAFRRLGVMRALLAAAGIDLDRCAYTHRTATARSLSRRFIGAQHIPYLWS